jgi:hypothetical protein
LKKNFNEERKAYLALEKDILDLERTNKMLNSDLKFLNEEFVKLQKTYQSELDKSKNLKIELEKEVQKRSQLQQDYSDMLNENSNLKIKEKQLTNQIKDLNEECLNIKLNVKIYVSLWLIQKTISLNRYKKSLMNLN